MNNTCCPATKIINISGKTEVSPRLTREIRHDGFWLDNTKQ